MTSVITSATFDLTLMQQSEISLGEYYCDVGMSLIKMEDAISVQLSDPAMELPQQPKSIEQKRDRRLVRNREAARRLLCNLTRNRLKKKEWVKGLQKLNQGAFDINQDTKARISILEHELTSLQNIILAAGISETN